MLEALRPGDPQQVGPYRLAGILGSGGMGQVFLGRSVGGRLVAVKIVRPELARDANFRQRFRREVQAARRVDGQFTALVVDADVDADPPWLATAYVAGPSLAHAVSTSGPLPADSVIALAAGLAEGLRAIHAAGVVHRDLKPSNVLLAVDGPRVIDFGISRATEATSLTHTGLVVGSPGFMSPEQAEGAPVGVSSDIFSLGAVLTFAATGEGPFGTGNTAALVYRVVHGQPDLGGLPDRIRPLIEHCLAKDPAQRPSPDEILTDLSDALSPMAGLTGWLPAAIAESFPLHAAHPEPTSGVTEEDAVPRHSTTETVARPRAVPASHEPEAAIAGEPIARTSARSPLRVGDAAQPPAPPSPPGGLGPSAGSRPKPPTRRRGRRLLWAGAAVTLAAAAAVLALPHVIGVFAAAHPQRTRQTVPAVSTATASPASTAPVVSKTHTSVSRSPHAVPQQHASPHSPSPAKTVSSAPATSPRTTSPPPSTGNPQPVSGSPPPPVSTVAATALSQYQVKVTWSESTANVTGFNVDNGCPVGACGGADAELYTTTGRVTSTTFTVTPGSYTCFRVQAFNKYGASAWSGYACRSTPSFQVPGTQEWIDTGVYMNSGDRLGMKAVGTVYIDPSYPVGPGGVSSCVPSTTYPNLTFPGPNLYCWSLIARVGNGAPFEVGASTFVRTGAGELYLGVNDNNFTDNSGSWTVNIARGGQATTP